MAFDFFGAEETAGAVFRTAGAGFVAGSGEVTEAFIGVNRDRLRKRAVDLVRRAKMWPAPQRAGHTTQLITTNER